MGRADDIGSISRRGALALLLGGGTAGATRSPVSDLLQRFAPTSGTVWDATGGVPETVESPYGPATVTYDDHHVPHVEADAEAAAYFAVGYAQAADRLFQMDVLRRYGSGRLAEVVGDFAVHRDVLRTKLDYPGAVQASAEAIAGSDAERMLAAYADGVTAYVERGSPGVEFGLLDYEPEPWTVADSLAVAMAMYDQQFLGFGTLREDVKRRVFDEDTYRRMYPRRFDHGAPVVRDHVTGATSEGSASIDRESGSVDPALVDWLGRFEGPSFAGSNAWTVSGDLTDSGEPILCSDPHLPLDAPPTLYQQRVSAGDVDVRGASIPGIPFFFVGETDDGAWGYTTATGDVIDFYAYDVDGDRYRLGDEWREFDTETRTIDVRDPIDGSTSTRDAEVKKTVHGPFLEREIAGETHHVGVAWTPLTGNRAAEAMYEWTTAEDVDEFRDALRKWDAIPGNVHFADRKGGTLYQFAGRIPIRRVDGEVVRGDRVFDGSAREAEWEGFEPYGRSTWEGFVPFEQLPAAIDADYVASANQRAADDPSYPLGRESHPGFRAERIYERLDEAVTEGRTVDREFVRSLQLDTLDVRARELVPVILDARDRMPEHADEWLDALADWDYRMDRDSAAALLFVRVVEHFERETWAEFFEERGLDRRYWPSQRVLLSLPADSECFDGDRAAVLAAAVDRAVREIEDEGWAVYGDYNRPAMTHQLGDLLPDLNYPRYPIDGSGATVRPLYGPDEPGGAAYRLISDLGGESLEVLPGGNDGSPYSEHYHDQLRLWADGEYTRLGGEPSGDPDVSVEGVDG